MEALGQWEGMFLLFLQDVVRTPVLTWLLTKITALGDAGWFWMFLAILFLFSKKYRTTGQMMVLALLLDFLVVNVAIKNIVCRVRPYEAVEGLMPLIERQVDWSFPSGHAASGLAAATAICLTVKSGWRYLPLALALLICFSRLYVGVHYPSDVLAGIVIGVLCAVAANYVWQRAWRSRSEGENR
ncbi:MAG TPA: phosphatase PAP2 family protein [Lachnospiraceae bacterium]|nr:phosphatase PAP2 family protein [Lachnospiraceae bacterium]